jgi:uncharacterized protein (DUF1330 family)
MPGVRDLMPAYLIASVIGVKDMDALRAYLESSPALIAAHGGRYSARVGPIEVFDGDFEPKRVTIVEFPTMDDVRAWYDSPEYVRIRPIRLENAESSMVLVEALSTALSVG